MTIHVPVEDQRKKKNSFRVSLQNSTVGLQILQVVFLMMYFFVNKVMQTYLKMVASLGGSDAISCQEGSLTRERGRETEPKFLCVQGRGGE